MEVKTTVTKLEMPPQFQAEKLLTLGGFVRELVFTGSEDCFHLCAPLEAFFLIERQ